MLSPDETTSPDGNDTDAHRHRRATPSNMTPAPLLIHLTSFTHPPPSPGYLLPASTIHLYTTLLAHAHTIFARPSSLWKAHIHLEPPPSSPPCTALASPNGWDLGWYFSDDFLDAQGRLNVWVHFERWGLEERIEVARRELGIEDVEEGEEGAEKEVGEMMRRGDECAGRGEWWDAVGWWKMAGRIRGGWKEEREKERAGKHEGEEENSPDKRETPSLCKKCKTGRDQTQSSSFSSISTLNALQNHLTSSLHLHISPLLNSTIASTIESSIHRALATHTLPIATTSSKRKRTPSLPILPQRNPLPRPPIPWPLTLPTTIPPSPSSPLTIDPYTSPPFSTALIVGRALPSICRSPLIRPLVRATLVAQKRSTPPGATEKGNESRGTTQPPRTRVYTWMPSEYGTVRNRTGEMQIPVGEVEWLEAFAGGTREERVERIKRALGEGREGEREEGSQRDRGDGMQMQKDTSLGHGEEEGEHGHGEVGGGEKRTGVMGGEVDALGTSLEGREALEGEHVDEGEREVLVDASNLDG